MVPAEHSVAVVAANSAGPGPAASEPEGKTATCVDSSINRDPTADTRPVECNPPLTRNDDRDVVPQGDPLPGCG